MRSSARRASSSAESSSPPAPRAATRAPSAPRCRPCRPVPARRREARRSRAGSRSAPPCGPGSGPAAPRAPAVERAAADRLLRLAPDLLDPLNHLLISGRPRRRAGRGRRYPLQDDRRRGGHVQRLGRRGAAESSPRARRPRAPSSGRPSRSAPRQTVSGSRQIAEVLAAVGDQRHPRARACRRPRPRNSGWAKTAPMLARTALGENGSALPGPSTTVPSTRAFAERITAPTLPGSPTPCR